MNESPERCKLKIGAMTLVVPVHRNLEETRAVAREVEERLAAIEASSSYVDTQRYAVQAAFEFAVEKRLLEERQREEVQDLAKALERLTSRLKSLAANFALDDPPS